MRSDREQVAGLLREKKYDEVVALIRNQRRYLRILNGLLFHDEDLIMWRAATMYGKLAAVEPEMVRPKLFSLLYSLNEESSVVGWGAGQALCEIHRLNPSMAADESRIVVHMMEDEDVSEPENRNTPMMVGSIWAIGNLADCAPYIVREMKDGVVRYLTDPDAQIRATTAWTLGRLRHAATLERLSQLLDDHASSIIYEDEELRETTVSAEAALAITRIGRP